MHPDLAPIAFLIGTWRGEGTGVYPTITGFAYGEEVRFSEVGKPFLAYTQRTWALDDGRPLHAEAGYWRPQPGGRLEVVLAHPTGVTEIQEGTVGEGRIELTATGIGLTGSAKEVAGLARTFQLTAPGTLRYQVAMAAAGQPLQGHLTAELHRVGEPG
ncbi:MAG: FABP family protein [Acidimicrobiia bacterium]